MVTVGVAIYVWSSSASPTLHLVCLNYCLQLSAGILHMMSPVKAREWEKTLKVKCRLCGGARCKRCSENAALAKSDTPVRGLHADWVADCALAMMRPSSRLMNDYKIAEQFHKLNITAVFNLTLPGEHPYCGDGLGASGFPYDPEKDLMAENIQFYNFGWEDMTTPTLAFMMDIVKVVASVLLTGRHKVAVHCHAGYGRTGITIACALIFVHNIPPELAIRLVRRDRPGSVQTTGQTQFVHDFHAYLNAARVVFALPKVHDRFTLAETLEHQNRRLHGEGAVNSNLPRVLDFLCAAVENAVTAASDVVTVASAFIHHLCVRHQEAWPRTSECTKAFYRVIPSETAQLIEQHRQFIAAAVSESQSGNSFSDMDVPEAVTREQLFPIKVGFNVGEWNWKETSALCPNASIHAILLLDWLEHLREPLLNSQLVEKLLHTSPVPILKLPSPKFGKPATTMHHSRSESESHPNSNNTIGSHYQFQGLHQLPAYAMKSLDRVLSCLRVLEAKLKQFDSGDVLFDAICVRTAIALFHLSIHLCSTASLRRHADCVVVLIKKWHAPKRLELNLESLQKLSVPRSATCRLTQSASTNNLSTEKGDKATSQDISPSKPHLSSRSPTRSTVSPPSSPLRTLQEPASPTNSLSGTLSEEIADCLLQSQSQTSDQFGSFQMQQPHKAQGEAQPRSSSITVSKTSPRSSPRPSSPIKMTPLPTTFTRRDEEDKPESKPPTVSVLPTPSASPKKVDLSPLPPQPVSDKESQLSDDSFTLSLSAEAPKIGLHTNPPVLPSVRDGGRYSRRAINTVK